MECANCGHWATLCSHARPNAQQPGHLPCRPASVSFMWVIALLSTVSCLATTLALLNTDSDSNSAVRIQLSHLSASAPEQSVSTVTPSRNQLMIALRQPSVVMKAIMAASLSVAVFISVAVICSCSCLVRSKIELAFSFPRPALPVSCENSMSPYGLPT